MQIRTARDIGLIIRERRRALQLAQRDLARRLSVSRQWVSEVERGKQHADLSLILRALTALGMTIDVRSDDGASLSHSEIDEVVRQARRNRE